MKPAVDPLRGMGLRDLDDTVVMVLHPQRYHLATMIATEEASGDAVKSTFELDPDYPVPGCDGVTEVVCAGKKFLVPDALLERFSRVKARGKIFYQSFDRGLPGEHYRLAITDPRFHNDYVHAVEALRSRLPMESVDAR